MYLSIKLCHEDDLAKHWYSSDYQGQGWNVFQMYKFIIIVHVLCRIQYDKRMNIFLTREASLELTDKANATAGNFCAAYYFLEKDKMENANPNQSLVLDVLKWINKRKLGFIDEKYYFPFRFLLENVL